MGAGDDGGVIGGNFSDGSNDVPAWSSQTLKSAQPVSATFVHRLHS